MAHDPAIHAALVELAGAFRRANVVHAAAGLRLFDAIGEGGSRAEEVARALAIPPLSARLLLDAIVGLGLLRREGDSYHLRAELRPWLRAGERCVIGEILLHRRENEVWLRAPAILRGEPAPVEYRRELLDSRLAAYPGIQRMNAILAQEIVATLGPLVDGAERVLDIGGGDGLYCGLVLARNPRARVRVIDLESGFVMCAAHDEQVRAGRLELQVGDGRTFTPEPVHDLVMIHELLELFPRAEKEAILRRAVDSLAPGGAIVVTKFDLDDEGVAPASSALFSLRMRMKTEASYLETNAEVVACLESAGCVDISVRKVQEIKAIIVARRPGPGRPAPAQPGETIMRDDPLSEQQIALWRELVSAATAFRSAAVLFAAAELDLFTPIAERGSTAEAIARAVGIEDVGVRLLLNALAAMGILEHREGLFRLHPDLRPLLQRGPHCIREEILQYRRENTVWLRLVEILRNDAGAREEAVEALESAHLPEYLTAVELSNRASAARLAERLRPWLAAARRALDIGGGNGDYAGQLLAAAPELRVTLLDRPAVIETARGRLEGLLQGGRLELVGGDALDLALEPVHDVVVISDLLHYFGDDDKQRVLAGARRALAPGGRVVVSKFTLEEGGSQPPHAALFSLKVHIKKADAYLEPDTRTAELMRAAGFGNVTVERLDAVKSIVIGEA